MYAIRLFFVALTCAAIIGCSPDIGVTDVQFGTFEISQNTVKFKAESIISKSKETPYGWAFSMRNPPKKLTVREVITGPAGISWDIPPNSPEIEISDNGKTVSVTKTISIPGSPSLFHNWTSSSTDPAGNYKATLYINNKLVREVDFVMVN